MDRSVDGVSKRFGRMNTGSGKTHLRGGSLPNNFFTIHGLHCRQIVAQCTARFASYRAMGVHFMYWHPLDSITILEVGSAPLPRCGHCGLHTIYSDLNGGHYAVSLRVWTGVLFSRTPDGLKNYAVGVALEPVSVFKYLGRHFSQKSHGAQSPCQGGCITESLWIFLQGSRPVCLALWLGDLGPYGPPSQEIGCLPPWGRLLVEGPDSPQTAGLETYIQRRQRKAIEYIYTIYSAFAPGLCY